jgi:hypothetical protein
VGYQNEVELRESLGLQSWRNLSKDTVIKLFENLQDTDPEVALKLVAQLPEITTYARAALDDTTRAYEAAINANTRSQDNLHALHMARLDILRAQLDKDLDPEERLRVYDDIREVNANALQVDQHNRRFLSEQLEKKLMATVAASIGVAAVVVTVAKAGHKPLAAASKLLKP